MVMTGMTEMTKKVKSPTWEQLPEVYGLTVIIVISVIAGIYVYKKSDLKT
jgi:hypothetical protein